VEAKTTRSATVRRGAALAADLKGSTDARGWGVTMRVESHLSWREFAGIVGVLCISGGAIGTLVHLVAWESGLPWTLYPLAAFWGFVAAIPFAVVAAPFAALLLIMVRRGCLRTAPRGRWVVAGAALGGIVGAFHPFVVLALLVDLLTPGSGHAGAQLALTTGLSGTVGGAIIGFRTAGPSGGRSLGAGTP